MILAKEDEAGLPFFRRLMDAAKKSCDP